MKRYKKQTLLVLGDKCDYDSYLKLRHQIQNSHPARFDCVLATYERLEQNRLPAIQSDEIIVFLFFPFRYWNANIESHRYRGIYGNEQFYNKFRALWSKIYHQLNLFYGHERLHFLNHPSRIATARDKELSKTILSDAGLRVSPEVFANNHQEILRTLNHEGKKLFVKVRYGSMGKGITYLENGRWMTNFRFQRGRIVSHRSDYNWTFVDVTGNTHFLKALLSSDVIIEEAVDSHLVDGLKYDLRFYICCNEVLNIYARTNVPEAVTTNISQGGYGRSSRFLRKIPTHILKEGARTAIEAAKAVGLGFVGVDIMISKDLKRVFVIELNSFPGFPKTTRFNLSRRILQCIGKHAGRGFRL